MARLVAILALICSLAPGFGPASAQDTSARAFTEKVAQALRVKVPGSTIEIVTDLELRIKKADGTIVVVALDNRFTEYKRDPTRLGAIVESHAAALNETRSAKLDRARIVPVIKDRSWLDDNLRELKARGLKQDFVFEDFNKELIVVFAEDTGNRTRFLMAHEEIGVDRKELRKLAVSNLSHLLPKIEKHQVGDLFAMMSAGGDYEASLLLFDDIWRDDRMKVEGDIVVAVPAKDALLVTGSKNRKGLAAMRKMVTKVAAEQRFRITDTLFVYRDGQFRKFGRK